MPSSLCSARMEVFLQQQRPPLTTRVALFLCLLLLLLLGNEALTDPSDIAALMDVRGGVEAASVAPGSCLSTWDFTRDPCESLFGEAFACGISCAEGSGNASANANANATQLQRIVSLELDSAGYSGVLSASIGNLTALQVLQISGNAFRAAIPDSLGALQDLRILDLSDNMFSSSLPLLSLASLHNLQTLNVAGNLLDGDLPPPSAIANLSRSLLHLQLFDNSFTGPLPDVSSFDQLRLLDLSNNDFFSSNSNYPSQQQLHLRFPPTVVSVSLRNNRLAGELSAAAIGEALSVLDLSGNNLTGAIDGSIFFSHPSLQQLNLSSNAFTSIIDVVTRTTESESSWHSSQLVAVDLSRNQIQGRLPTAFASMPRLASLSLSHNQFHGRIEMSYALKAVAGMVGLQPLRRLMLDSNYLTGPLPPLFLKLLPEAIIASVVDNCLFDACSPRFFFCQGASQKPHSLCRFAVPSPT